MLVLSCDKYKCAWDDFFNLRDRFWPDCPYKWYLVTENESYERDNVVVIQCGNDRNWTGRLKYAVEYVSAEYVGILLEDYFIDKTVDNAIIESDLQVMKENGVSIINVGDWWNWLINQPNKRMFSDHLVIIDNHLRSGLSAVPIIWNSRYLLDVIGDKDCNAWEFEIDRSNEAASDEGFKGLLLCDDRKPFNTTVVPVLIQGKLYPKAIKHFRKLGYVINKDNYTLMNRKEVIKYDFKHYAAKITFGRRFLKWVGTHVFGYTFFSDKYAK